MSFIFTPTSELPEVVLIKGRKFQDERGFFSESFRSKEFLAYGIPPFVQENHSRSSPLVLRGLHYQLNPKAQGKLVYCTRGWIVDVAVDIRKNSPTFGKWTRVLLGGDPNLISMLYIPPGFAHGFCVSDAFLLDVDVVYKVTEYYAPEYERSILWNDPSIGIDWGLPKSIHGDRLISEYDSILISDKDASAPLLKDAENNFVYGE